MSERVDGRSYGRVVVLVFTLAVSASVVACRDANKQDAPKGAAEQPDAAVAAAAPAVPVDSASTASAVVDVAGQGVDGVEANADAGADGGKRRLRRLVKGGDAGVLETQAAIPQPVPAAPEPAVARKVVPGMGNDKPYGGAAGSGAPILKKTPLPGEDPWK